MTEAPHDHRRDTAKVVWNLLKLESIEMSRFLAFLGSTAQDNAEPPRLASLWLKGSGALHHKSDGQMVATIRCT